MKHEINLLPHQKATLLSKKKKTALIAGLGSGKTFVGAVWTLIKLQEYPDTLGLIVANTYGQLQKATLAACFKFYEKIGLEYDYNKQLSVLTLAGTKRFLCLSAENYDSHRGIEAGEAWFDEAAYFCTDAFKVLSARVRDRHAKKDILITTTPKGMNWLYDYFHPHGEKYKVDLTETITAKTKDNPFLPEDYEQTLRDDFGSSLARQELDAEFVKLSTGLAYYSFNSDINTTSAIDLNVNEVVYVGLDFNVNPYCAVLSHFRNDMIDAFDEIYLENSNTPAMVDAIVHKVRGATVRILPDSTQIKRSTLGITDIEMLRRHFEVIGTRNPFVIDRVNNVNRLFEKRRIRIHPRCVKLINDLNKVTWKEKVLELDQVSNRMLTHTSDCLGYIAWSLLPFIKKQDVRVGHYA